MTPTSYVAVEIQDDIILGEASGFPFETEKGDAIEIYIDPDLSRDAASQGQRECAASPQAGACVIGRWGPRREAIIGSWRRVGRHRHPAPPGAIPVAVLPPDPPEERWAMVATTGRPRRRGTG